jgi:hypothetical protein
MYKNKQNIYNQENGNNYNKKYQPYLKKHNNDKNPKFNDETDIHNSFVEVPVNAPFEDNIELVEELYNEDEIPIGYTNDTSLKNISSKEDEFTKISDLEKPPRVQYDNRELSENVLTEFKDLKQSYDKVNAQGFMHLKFIDIMQDELNILKSTIIETIKESYKDIAPGMKIAKVSNIVLDLVNESMTLLTRFIQAYEAQQTSFKDIFSNLNNLAGELKKSEEIRKNEEMQSSIIRKLLTHKSELKEHALKLKGYINPLDLERFTRAIEQFDNTT